MGHERSLSGVHSWSAGPLLAHGTAAAQRTVGSWQGADLCLDDRDDAAVRLPALPVGSTSKANGALGGSEGGTRKNLCLWRLCLSASC